MTARLSIGERAVHAARGWIGTPYLHQASCRGAGCDCLGLVRGVWRELYGAEPEAVPPYTPDWSESSGEEAMLAGVRRHLAEVGRDDMRAGDILVFRMRPRSVAKHMGIVAGDRARWTLIHAYSGRAVVESPLGPGLLARIAGVFRLPSTEVTGRGD